MKTRAQSYGQEAACLLRDITMYRVMTKEQVLRLYPGKRTNTVYSGFASEEKLSESGLLGPVKIVK